MKSRIKKNNKKKTHKHTNNKKTFHLKASRNIIKYCDLLMFYINVYSSIVFFFGTFFRSALTSTYEQLS